MTKLKKIGLVLTLAALVLAPISPAFATEDSGAESTVMSSDAAVSQSQSESSSSETPKENPSDVESTVSSETKESEDDSSSSSLTSEEVPATSSPEAESSTPNPNLSRADGQTPEFSPAPWTYTKGNRWDSWLFSFGITRGYISPTPVVEEMGMTIESTLKLPFSFTGLWYDANWPWETGSFAKTTFKVWSVNEDGTVATEVPSMSQQFNSGMFPSISEEVDFSPKNVGVYYVQFQTAYRNNQYASMLIKVVVTAEEVKPDGITVSAPKTIFPSKDNFGEYTATAKLSPSGATGSISWSADSSLELKQNTGYDVKFFPKLNSQVNMSKDSLGFPAEIAAHVNGKTGQADTFVGGLAALEGELTSINANGLSHTIPDINSLAAEFHGEGVTWSYNWKAFETSEATNGDVLVNDSHNISLAGVDNTSGSGLTSLSPAQVALHFSGDDDIVKKAAQADHPYALQCEITATHDQGSMTFYTNYAGFSIEDNGKLTFTSIPLAGEFSYTPLEYYTGKVKSISYTTPLAVSDTRSRSETADKSWELTVSASPFESKSNGKFLPFMQVLTFSSIPEVEASFTNDDAEAGASITVASGKKEVFTTSVTNTLTPEYEGGGLTPGSYQSTLTWTLHDKLDADAL